MRRFKSFTQITSRRSGMAATTRGTKPDDAKQDSTQQRRPSPAKPKVRDESDLGSDMQGKNKLQGEDQATRHNQRQTTPDEGG
jgi:hypothetical protein